MSQTHGIGDRASSNAMARLEWQLNQIRELGGVNGGGSSSAAISAGIDASADINAILAAIGNTNDGSAIATIIGRLTRISTALENQLEPPLIEYQTAASATWLVGYVDRDSVTGDITIRNFDGDAVGVTASRVTGGTFSLTSNYYKSTVASPGVVSAGISLRQIIVDRVGVSPPLNSTIIWQNMDTLAVLTTPPIDPYRIGDEIPLKMQGPFLAVSAGQIPSGARGFEIVNLSPDPANNWTFNGTNMPGTVSGLASDAYVGQAIPYSPNSAQLLISWWEDSISMPQTTVFRAFTNNIRLDVQDAIYATHQIAGPTTITIDPTNAMLGATALLRIVSDGVNIPVINGSIRANASAPFYNGAGVENMLQIMWDGVTFWSSWWQADGIVPPDLIAPTLQSAVISPTAPDRVVLTYSENLQTTPPANTAYATNIAGRSVTGIVISGSTITIAFNGSFAGLSNVTLNYAPPTANPIRDTSGNNAAGFANQAINNLAANSALLPFTTRSGNVSVNAAGTVYNASNGTDWAEFMLADKYLPANTDGWVAIDRALNTGGVSAVLGFNTSNINQGFAGYEYFCWVSGGVFLHGTNGGSVTNTTINSTEKFRLRRSAGTIAFESSANGGATWQNVYTWPGTQNGALYVNCAFPANGNVTNPIASSGFIS